MVSAVDPKTQTDGLNKIGSQTALFTTDSDAPQTNRVAYIGSSNIDAGLQAAEIAKKAMPDGGKCIGFVGLLGADNAKERIQGMKDGLKGTKIELTDVRGDDIDQTRAKKNVEDALVASPDVTCMRGDSCPGSDPCPCAAASPRPDRLGRVAREGRGRVRRTNRL